MEEGRGGDSLVTADDMCARRPDPCDAEGWEAHVLDDKVVGQLLDSAATRLAAYGYLLTGSQSGADALVQVAIVKVAAGRRRITDLPVAEGRVRLAMRSIHLAELRRAGTWRAKYAPRVARGGAAKYSPDLAARNAVGKALSALTAEQRAVVVLHHYEHLQIPEIAAAMRTAEATVSRHLAHAHAMLTVNLGEIQPEADRIPIVDGRRR